MHYTVRKGYMNDPNGLLYDAKKKIYHLGFQYLSEVSPKRCDNCWGHAFSENLVDWTETGPILVPDKYGIIASGSGVVDVENSSGLFAEKVPPERRFVVFYTSMNLSEKRQAIAIAFSEDGFRYVPYDGGRPILYNNESEFFNEFRDPKVIRLEETKEWLMIVGGGRLKLFRSKNLLEWEFQSTIKNVDSEEETIDGDMKILQKYLPNNDPNAELMVGECPDLFELTADDGQKKWILTVGGIFYVVGSLLKRNNRYEFACESRKRRLFGCTNFFAHRGEGYASQSFYNDEKGRKIIMAWLMDTTADEENKQPYNGATSLPLEAKLSFCETGGFVLKFRLTEEIFERFVRRALPDKRKFELTEDTFLMEILFSRNSTDRLLFSDGKRKLELSISENELIFSADDGAFRDSISKKFSFDRDRVPVTLVFDKFVLTLLIGEISVYTAFVFGNGFFERFLCDFHLQDLAEEQLKLYTIKM